MIIEYNDIDNVSPDTIYDIGKGKLRPMKLPKCTVKKRNILMKFYAAPIFKTGSLKELK